MKELSAQYPRYGYRRIRIFLGRDRRASDVRRPGAPVVAGSRASGTAQAAEEARGGLAAASAGALRSESALVLTTSCSIKLKCLTLTDEFTK